MLTWHHPIAYQSPLPLQVATHNLLSFQLDSYTLGSRRSKDVIENEQPVMSDNLFAASAAHWLSSTY